MSVSSVVITMSVDSDRRASALSRIRSDAHFELGEPHGRRVPVVIDARSTKEGRDLFEWLCQLDGVDHADLLFVSMDEYSGLFGARDGCATGFEMKD